MSSQTQGHSESKSYHYQAVPLLRPDEVMRWPEHQSLIMRTGYAPVKAGQFVWYKEREMKGLILIPVEIPEQKLTASNFFEGAGHNEAPSLFS